MTEKRPNFVVIVADDLGWADVSYHGSKIKTPNLDRLAREGVELDQHYVAPVCSPTRPGILSGRYWSRFGCTSPTNSRVMPFGTPTLASTLKAAGYDTAITGKWHLGSKPEWGPRQFGFDHSYGSLAGGVGPLDHRYKKGPFSETWHRNDKLVQEQGHVTDLITNEAVRWVESRTEKPFFLYLPYTAPHIPMDEPKAWLDRYLDIGVPTKRQFAACVSHMDDGIGQVVRALERAGKRENTLIVFTSDNGAVPAVRNNDPNYPGSYLPGPSGGSNEPLRGNKGQLYEGGIRVPAFITWPGKLKPSKLAAPIHVVDWMPTLCALAGYPPSSDLKWDGQDVWLTLTGGSKPTPRQLYWAGPGFRTAAVRDGDWKLLVHRGDSERAELFDLARDPCEKTDVAAQRPERVAALKKLLAELSARDNDMKVTER